jgi:DNA-binding CsgD family transcriptional regulator
MTQRVSSRIFAGRERELGQLVAALAGVADGSPAIVLVGGEAGIGKSRLLAELAARADDRGVRVLRGQCAGLEDAAIPLLPVANALSELDDEGRAPDRPAPSARLAPGPSARAYAAVLDRLARASAAGPVLLSIEDLHWADRSTLDLLAFLARRMHGERLLIVATFRNDEVDRRDGLRRFLADVATAPGARRLELAGLARGEMREQIAGILGSSPPAPLAEAVFARSDGNPFFAEELVAVAGSGAAELTPTLRDMLLARIAALDAGAQAVVRSAAAGGREVDHRLLAIAAGLTDPELTEALRAAVRHQVLVARDKRFAFRHALLQEAAYGELLPGERARLHAAFAAALEADPGLAGGTAATVAAEIAHHWLNAGDQPRALAAAVRAGGEAERVGALAEAAGHDARALALWHAVTDAEQVAGIDRATLLARAADATAWSGRPAEAIDLVDEALALTDAAADSMGTAALHGRRGLYLWQLGRAAEGVPDYERAVALIPAEPPSAERSRALSRLGLGLLLAGDRARSREEAEKGLAVARAIRAPAEEADALVCIGQARVGLGERPAGLEQLQRAREIALELHDDERLSHVAVALSHGLFCDGQFEQAIAVALDGAEVSLRAGLEARERLCKLNAGDAAYDLGRWDLVERISRELLAEEFAGVTHAGAHQMAGALARARGDLDAAAAHLAAQREGLGPDATAPDCYGQEDEVELALWRGDPAAAARAALDGAHAEKDATRSMVLATLGARAEADLAELARARRDDAAEAAARARARAFRDRGRAHAAAADHPGMEATLEAEYARAQGGSDPALWDAAARAWEARSTPFQAAYARWRQAEAALARRDRAQGAQALAAAHATATELGAGALRSEIEALARRARIDLARDEPAAEEPASDAAAELGLTARELEVLEHLALGQTNRQIADELFISIKTAGVHVSHILSKLGAANRSEAGAIAHRLGLVR